jgi:small-conductance mechanosensitive channel
MPIDLLQGYLPNWAVRPTILLLYTIGFYLIGKLFVKPISFRICKRKSKHIARPLSQFSLYTTVLVGLGIGLSASGYGNILTVLGTIIAAGTVAVGFALKDTLSAFASGIFIYLDKPFIVGDWIEWNGHAGRVKDITIRTTKVETFNNELLTVPNNELTSNVVKNPVANDKLRVTTTIGIGYDDDIGEASQHVKEILDDIDAILDQPAPDVQLTGLGDSAVELTARYWIKPDRKKFVTKRAEVLKQVKQRFDEEGIDMPYPTTTIAGDSLSISKD